MTTSLQREAEAFHVEPVSTPDSHRVCRATPGKGKRGYCGRKSAPIVATWDAVECADCRAAARADGISA